MKVENGAAVAEFTLGADKRATFVLEEDGPGKESQCKSAAFASRVLQGDAELLAEMDDPLHLPGALAGDGEPLCPDAETAHLPAARFHGRRAHVRPARKNRRRGELGLSLHMDPRRLFQRQLPHEPRLHRGGKGVHGLDRRPLPRDFRDRAISRCSTGSTAGTTCANRS